MIGKGNPHNSGVGLADYLVEDDLDHTAELVEMCGFGAVTDIRQAFHAQHVIAKNATRGDAPFFHLQVCPAAEDKDKVSRKDLVEIGNRYLAGLGLEMQPHAKSFHTDRITGEMHLHMGVSLVKQTEDGKCYIQKLGLYKNKLIRISRQIEKDYGLRIVSNERKPGNRARAPKRKEHEESNRLDTDVNAIRNTILDCYEKSDSGKAFNAAMTAQGWILSNGTKRDCFVVLDHAGGHHALNKALTGKTLAQTEKRFGDIDRTQLPSVDQAKAMQRDRQGERQQAKQREPDKKPPGKTTSEIREAAASPDFARGLKERGLILAYVTPEAAKASQRGKALAKAAGRQNRALKEGFVVVNERWNVSRIDARTAGKHLEKVQKQLAQIDRSQLPSVAEARAQIKEINRAAREKNGAEPKTVHALEAKESEIMSELAQLHRAAFEAAASRTTEPVAPTFDRDAASDVWQRKVDQAGIDAQIEKEKAARQEAQRAAWKAERAAEREAARPASWLENRIAECAQEASLAGAPIVRDQIGKRMSESQILADKLDGWRAGIEAARTGEPNTYQHKGEAVTVYGKEAFAARCEEAGISIVRVTASDTIALDALRSTEYMQRLAAETNREVYKGNRFAPLEAGELAAVTRGGDVYRINAEKLGDAAGMLVEKLPGVIEARDACMDDRAKTEKLWENWTAERTTDREGRAKDRESRAAGAHDRREERQTAREVGAALDKGFGIARKLAEKVIKLWESAVDVLFGWAMAPAPLTGQQVHDKRQAQGNVETLHAEAVVEMRQAHDNARDEQISDADRDRNIREAELYSRFGYILNQPAQPREIQRDGGRERERERD